MASTGISSTPPAYSSDHEKRGGGEKGGGESLPSPIDDLHMALSHTANKDATHRKLKARHIQLIGIGGTIGTALYVRTYEMNWPYSP